jgi:predicted nucleic acid-binding protein
LKHIFLKRKKEALFTSSLSIVQTITRLQTENKHYKRKAFSREQTINELNSILPKFTVLSLSYEDIKNGFNYLNKDVEDSIHYVVSQKMKCDAILTNNISDFSGFKNVLAIIPDLGVLKSILQ